MKVWIRILTTIVMSLGAFPRKAVTSTRNCCTLRSTPLMFPCDLGAFICQLHPSNASMLPF